MGWQGDYIKTDGFVIDVGCMLTPLSECWRIPMGETIDNFSSFLVVI